MRAHVYIVLLKLKFTIKLLKFEKYIFSQLDVKIR